MRRHKCSVIQLMRCGFFSMALAPPLALHFSPFRSAFFPRALRGVSARVDSLGKSRYSTAGFAPDARQGPQRQTLLFNFLLQYALMRDRAAFAGTKCHIKTPYRKTADLEEA